MPYTLLAETSGVATFGRERRHRDVVVVVIDVIDVIDWMLNIILIFRPLAKFLVYWLNFITWHCNLKLNYDLGKRSLECLSLRQLDLESKTQQLYAGSLITVIYAS